MKFYINKDDYENLTKSKKPDSDGDILRSAFFWNRLGNYNREYLVVMKIKRIDKRPLKEKSISLWNSFVRKFII